jgi:hypothetical protein
MLSPNWPSGGKFAPALLAAEDPHTQYPVIQKCDTSLTCSGAASLSGSQLYSAPAKLIPSAKYADDGTVFAQTGRGTYKSTNGGVTFQPLVVGQPGATTTATPMMAVAPGYTEAGPTRTAYVAVFQAFVQGKVTRTAGGVYRTVDGGATWAPLASPGPFDQGAFGVAVAPNGRLFAGFVATTRGQAGLLCSVDGGSTWRAACPPLVARTNQNPTGGVAAQCGQVTCASPTSQGDISSASGAGRTDSPDGKKGGDQGTPAGARGVGSGSRPTFLMAAVGGIITVLVAVVAAAIVTMRRRRRPDA